MTTFWPLIHLACPASQPFDSDVQEHGDWLALCLMLSYFGSFWQAAKLLEDRGSQSKPPTVVRRKNSVKILRRHIPSCVVACHSSTSPSIEDVCLVSEKRGS